LANALQNPTGGDDGISSLHSVSQYFARGYDILFS
jgi:hypothetical protein